MKAWDWPRWIAHRAGGCAAPENTLDGLRAARAAGLRAIEIDVRLSADGVPVVIHDDTLLRTAGRDLRVDALSAEQLGAIRVDHGWPPALHGEVQVPDLARLLVLAMQHGLRVNIELKPGQEACGTLAQAVSRCLADCIDPASETRVLVSSFEPAELSAMRSARPRVPVALLSERADAGAMATACWLDAVALNLAWEHCTPEAVRAAQEAGLQVCAWTVNDAADAARLFSLGVAAVFTDRLELAATATPA